MKNFVGNNAPLPRVSSEKDVDLMEETFRDLEFIVKVVNDPSKRVR